MIRPVRLIHRSATCQLAPRKYPSNTQPRVHSTAPIALYMMNCR